MSSITVELTKKQVLGALCQLPAKEAQSLILDFFRKKSEPLPSFREIHKEVSAHVRKHKISHSVVEEAVQWARSQK